ncbi:MAG: PKD domain-containing protein [Thermoplasmata archaeon]
MKRTNAPLLGASIITAVLFVIFLSCFFASGEHIESVEMQWTKVATTYPKMCTFGHWQTPTTLNLFQVNDTKIEIYNSNGTRVDNYAMGHGINDVLPADVDNDGLDEIFVGWLNGTNATVSVMNQGWTVIKSFSKQGASDSNVKPYYYTDINDDGNKEVVCAVDSGYSKNIRGVVVFDYNTASEKWYGPTAPGITNIQIGDVNNNGALEIIASSYGCSNGRQGPYGDDDSHSFVYAWDASGNLLWGYNTGDYFTGCDVGLSDINNDGTTEIVAILNTAYDYRTDLGKLVVLDGSGNVLSSKSFTRGKYGLVMSEFNSSNDGKEIIVGSNNQKIQMYDKNLNLLHEYTFLSTQDAWHHIVPGFYYDLDGDNNTEIVTIQYDRTTSQITDVKVVIFSNNLEVKNVLNVTSSTPWPGANVKLGKSGNDTIIVAILDKTYIYRLSGLIYTVRNALPSVDITTPADWSTYSPLVLTSNVTVDDNGTIINYTWSFGDGNYSYEPAPTHTWASKGTFNINLTVTDNRSGTSSVERSISITNSAPSAMFDVNTTSAQTYASITFYEPSDPTDIDGYVTMHVYDFGDGGTTSIMNESKTSVEHIYASKGVYNVTLRVYDNDGGFALKKVTVTIINSLPTLQVPVNLTSQSLTAVRFNATVSDIDGVVVNYSWDFGDASFECNYTDVAYHQYTRPGNYVATITIRDNDGGTVSKTTLITIANRIPTCSFTASTDKRVGEEIAFTANAIDLDGTVTKYKWTFGDGNTTDWLGNNTLKHTYLKAGQYTVSLIVMDDDNGTSTINSDTVSASNNPPVADVIYPQYIYVGEEARFLGNNSYDTYGSIVSYLWNFGDGMTSIDISPNHTYKKAGNYTLSLKVIDDFGEATTIGKSIVVEENSSLVAQTSFKVEEKGIMDYINMYSNLLGFLVAGLGSASGFFFVRKKRAVLDRQMSLIEETVRLQNPYEAYTRLSKIQEAASKLLKNGNISENNYIILDNKIRDSKHQLEKKYPSIQETRPFQQQPYQDTPNSVEQWHAQERYQEKDGNE